MRMRRWVFGYIVECMGSRIYGYARVSTTRQDAALQRDALEGAATICWTPSDKEIGTSKRENKVPTSTF